MKNNRLLGCLLFGGVGITIGVCFLLLMSEIVAPSERSTDQQVIPLEIFAPPNPWSIQMTVLDWQILSAKTLELSIVEPGYRPIAVEVVMENEGIESYDIYPNIFFLKDEAGQLYGVDIWGSSEINNRIAGVGGKLTEGGKLRGKMIFHLPVELDPARLLLIYQEPASDVYLERKLAR